MPHPTDRPAPPGPRPFVSACPRAARRGGLPKYGPIHDAYSFLNMYWGRGSVNVSWLGNAMRHRGWGRRWAWLALLPALAGCAELQNALTPPGEETAAQAPVATPAPTEEPGSRTAALSPTPHPPTRPATPRPQLDPETLKGLDQQQALDLFGRPHEISEAAPATVWHYGGKKCQLDLFFYMDLGTHTFHVLTYEFRPEERSAAVQRACLNRLREASRGH